MSTSGLGQWSVAQPSTTYSGTVTNNCRPHSQAAVCADVPWLTMMGMRGTVALVFALRRSVQGGVTLLDPFALHGFLQHSPHAVGFLHAFVDHRGPFPRCQGWAPSRLLVVPATLLT
jgi:hypothetical protein